MSKDLTLNEILETVKTKKRLTHHHAYIFLVKFFSFVLLPVGELKMNVIEQHSDNVINHVIYFVWPHR